MKMALLMLVTFFTITSSSFAGCYNIYLKNGTIIEGVESKLEDVFGIKYLVYNFKGSSSISRIEYSTISKIVHADCKPAPTPIIIESRPISSETKPVQTARQGQARNQILENLKRPEFRPLGILGYNLIQPYFVEIKIDEVVWNRLPYDDKIKLLNILASGWENACQQDGVGRGSISFKGYRSGKTLASRAWHGDWRIRN